MFKKLLGVFTPKKKSVPQERAWKKGMWVSHTETGETGIIFQLGNICEIHYVDVVSGETIRKETVDIQLLRQARWVEIPVCRRFISEEKGKELGYGS